MVSKCGNFVTIPCVSWIVLRSIMVRKQSIYCVDLFGLAKHYQSGLVSERTLLSYKSFDRV